jgi:hypothetical protein
MVLAAWKDSVPAAIRTVCQPTDKAPTVMVSVALPLLHVPLAAYRPSALRRLESVMPVSRPTVAAVGHVTTPPVMPR